jgi:stress response protein YsnF
MTSFQQIDTWRGRTAVDPEGDKIGSIEEVYLDRQSGEPEWIAVKTGLFGRRVSFVPSRDAELDGDDVRVGFEKDTVKDAPNIEADGELSPEEERALYEHYGRSDYGEWTNESEDRTAGVLGADPRDARSPATGTTASGATAGLAGATSQGAPAASEGDRAGLEEGRAATGQEGRAAAVPEGGAADTAGQGAMTRSEEELRVGTEARETGRARLRKYVTTEEESKTVPLRREEARVEREPVSDANVEEAMSGPDISEAEHEVILHTEEPVVEKRVEPKERVRLEKDVHTEQETVSDELRKEHIEPEDDAGRDPA